MPNILPIVFVGAAAYYFGKKKRKKKSGKQKALGQSAHGTIFPAGEVDVIEANVGERFTVSIPEQAGLGYVWELAASPPDETIKLADDSQYADSKHLFIFDAKKAGSGALVFHFLRSFERGEVPPDKVLEIQTKVSKAG